MHDKGGDACSVQPSKLFAKREPRPDRPILQIEQIAGDHQKLRPFAQAQIDDSREGLQRRAAKKLPQPPVGGHTPKGRVEVKVGGMNEFEAHTCGL